MITVVDKTVTSNISLSAILNCKTKVDMLKICRKLDLYVSPNLYKAKTAERLASEMLYNVDAIYYKLNKNEIQLLGEFIQAGPNQYIVRKARKMEYMLQKLCLVVTYIDTEVDEWHMLMPDIVRETLATDFPLYKKMVDNGMAIPSPKELRFMDFMHDLYGDGEKG